MNLDSEKVYEIRNSFLQADKLIPDVIEEKRIMAVKSEDAIYNSRLLQFQDVLDRRNVSNYSVRDSTRNYDSIISNDGSLLLLDLNLPDININFE